MAKMQSSLKYILKIHSSRLRRNNWRLNISFQEAKKNKETISIADSQTLRFIRNIRGYNIPEDRIKKISKELKKIKKLPTSLENKQRIKELYKEKDSILFTDDYIAIIMDSIKDFNRCNLKKSFFVNGKKYRRLYGTTGGIKKQTIVYINDEIYGELNKRIDNGRNKTVKLVPAKLEAYKALTNSSSIPVSYPKGVLVVNDATINFKANIVKIDDTTGQYPVMTNEKDYPIEMDFCDGCAMILPSLSKKWAEELKLDYTPSGFNMRNSWCKGMVFTFDFLDFAENVAHKYIVKDAWGNDVDIRDIELILTTNMLKLWNCYESIDHYLKCCKENGYTFGVAKVCPKELENERNMNYQFLQSYDFSDKDIKELIKPTVDEIKDVLGGDYRKTLLFLKGINITDENAYQCDFDYLKALMIEPKMLDDPFVKQKIHNMIKKRINDAKIGVIKVQGNYSIVAGDVYGLCQHIFGMAVTGLLKDGEYYSRTWLDKGVNKIVSFRAPMTCHNNIKVMRLVENKDIEHWFKYMKTCTVINAWDTTTHAMNGMDMDSDAIISTNNPVILRKTQELDAIVCVQKSTQKVIVDEKAIIQSNKDGFGDEIGSITNRITAMFEVLAKFPKGSEEYKTLMYRIMCGQNFQQNAIDKIKGIKAKPMPKEWYEYKPNRIKDDDSNEIKEKKEFNIRILADKKPYFFIYIYPHLMNMYKKYLRDTDTNCLMRFGMTVSELEQKEDKDKKEILFLEYYNLKMPVGNNPCVMNKICWEIEKEFDNFNDDINYINFDYNILKTNVEYSCEDFTRIKDLYKDYNKRIREYSKIARKERLEKDEKKIKRDIFKDEFKEKAFSICNNKNELINILVDLCYISNSSKQFVWDIAGDIIVDNLLEKNNNTINYPVLDEKGDINFAGYKFLMHTKEILQ